MEYVISIGERKIHVEKNKNGLTIDGKPWNYEVARHEDLYHIYKEQTIEKVRLEKHDGNKVHLNVNGKHVEVAVQDHIALMLEKLGMDTMESETVNEIVAPMPGVILNIMVKPGQEVKKGEPLLILEAMKMENLIKAPADATVESITVEKGQSVEKNTPLVKFA